MGRAKGKRWEVARRVGSSNKNWTLEVSIPLPPTCEAGALPSELNAQSGLSSRRHSTTIKGTLQDTTIQRHSTPQKIQNKNTTIPHTHHLLITDTHTTLKHHCHTNTYSLITHLLALDRRRTEKCCREKNSSAAVHSCETISLVLVLCPAVLDKKATNHQNTR